MPTTLAALEGALIARQGGRIDLVELAGPAPASCRADTSPRAYLAGPLAEACAFVGIATASPLAVATADLASIPDGSTASALLVAKILDVAELKLMESILGNLDAVNESANGKGLQYGSWADGLLKLIEYKTAKCRRFGYGLSPMVATRVYRPSKASGPIVGRAGWPGYLP